MTTKQQKPMLAEDVDLAKLKYPVIGMPKIDGVRQVFLPDVGRATGRSLKTFPNRHLQGLFSALDYLGLDGELALTGQETSPSLCRDTTSAVMSIEGEPDVTWWVFDAHPQRGGAAAMRYTDRLVLRDKAIRNLGLPHVRGVPYVWIYSEEQLLAYHSDNLAKGFEGTIVRDPDGDYKHGRSTVKEGGYLRMKQFEDREAVVLSITEAQENRNEAKTNELGRTERSTHKANLVGKAMVGGLICHDPKFGEISVGPGEMPHDLRAYYWQNPHELIGKTITYKTMSTGVKDLPRFPTFKHVRPTEDISA